MKSCVNCGKQIPDEAVFCPYCGNEQKSGFFCPNCGKAIEKARNFCPGCGHELNFPGQTSGRSAESEAKQMTYASFSQMGGNAGAEGDNTETDGAGNRNRRPADINAGSGRFENKEAGNSWSDSSGTENSGAGRFRTDENNYRPFAGSQAINMNATQSRILAICQNVWMLVFCIGFTANLLVQMFTQFSWFSVLSYIVSIVLCCGIWMIYAGSRKNTLNATGFAIVSVIQTIYLVLWCIVGAFLVVLGIRCITDDVSVAGGLLIFILAFLMVYYQFVLRRTARKAAFAAKGESDSVPVSLYSIVILCIGIVGRVILFFALLSMQSLVNDVTGGVSYYGNSLNSSLGELFDITGSLSSYGYNYGYDYGYSAGTEFLSGLTESAVNMIQTLFGVQDNFLPTLLAILTSVCVVVLLIKLRACVDKKR